MSSDPRPFPNYTELSIAGWQSSRRRDPVETLWTVRATEPQDYVVLPDGRADLIARFRIAADGTCGDIVPLLVGPSSLHHSVRIEPGDGFVGVRLRPGRLGFLRDASDLRDRQLAGDAAVRMVPALAALPKRTNSIDALVGAFREFIRALGESAAIGELETALDRLHLAGGRIAPGDLARALDLGPRRLHRLFARHVGLSPQLYAAVLRFQRGVRLRRRGMPVAATAYEAGFADQSHMTRAFKRYGDFTPASVPDVTLGWMPLR